MIALITGRFQPLHKGHVSLIKKACRENDLVKIAIGSAQHRYTKRNPFSLEERVEMIRKSIKFDNYKLFWMEDVYDCENWVKHVEKTAGKFDIVYFGINSVDVELFGKAGYETKIIRTNQIYGTKVRELIAQGDNKWMEYVSEGVIDAVLDVDGVERIKTLYKIIESPKLTVDLIIELYKCEEYQGIILVKRANPPHGWALPGGFVDCGETLKKAAIREAKEETSLNVKDVSHFGYYDDPSRDPRNHTVTHVFIGKANGNPAARSDAKRVGVFFPEKLPDKIAFDHRKIIKDYWKKWLMY